MAAKVADNTMEDVANSLTEAEVVPTKLRCAICDKVAFNAFKLPCCDQNICGTCQSSLPEACPICQHSPLNAEDAKPSKSLRLTVAQFLKSIKKKREKAQSATGGDNTPTSATEPTTPAVDVIPAVSVNATLEPSETQNGATESADTSPLEGHQLEYDSKQEVEATAERVAEEDAELHELEATTAVAPPDQDVQEEGANVVNIDDDDAESENSDIEIVTGDEDKTAANPWGEGNDEEYQEEEQWDGQDEQNQMNGQVFGYPGSDQGDMSMFNGMTPEMMQMMMQQMSGMQNGSWPNMMGIPGMGMGMNPMDMFAAFGMQGMGGVNPNMMNMNGMNGMMGMDFNGSFGGSWNGQQMAGSDFGASSGYYPDGGYNQSSLQGNYPPHMSHRQNQQFSMKNNSYNQQGSFRGSHRGFGRGYQNQGYHNRSHSQNFSGVSEGPPPNAPTGPKAQREGMHGSFHHQAHNRASSKAVSDRQQALATDDGTNKDTTNYDDKQQVSDNTRDLDTERASEQPAKDDNRIATEDINDTSGDAPYNKGNDTPSYWNQANGTPNEGQYDQRSYRGGSRGHGGFEPRGGWRGRGGSNWQYHGTRGPEAQSTPPVEPTGIGVEGAPSGPKAMREANAWRGRDRGGIHAGGRGQNQSISSAKPEDLPDNRARSRTRSPSRERSRSASRRHSRRYRSRTPTSDSEYERRRERKRRRAERKYEDEYDDAGYDDDRLGPDESAEDKYRSSRRENDRYRSSKSQRDPSRERRKHRRRSRSPDRQEDSRDDQQATVSGDDIESKEKERRRDRDKYRDRSRDRDRHREKDRDRERDKKRSSRRDHSASPESQHRSSHRSSRDKDKDKDKDQRERERDKDRESHRASAAPISKSFRPDTPSVQKQLEQGFRIHGRSKEKERDRSKTDTAAVAAEAATPPTAPSGPAADSNTAKMQPPTGPRADRGSAAPSKLKFDIANLNTKASTLSAPRISANSSRRPSQPATPTPAATPRDTTPLDPYEEERRKAQEARIAKEMSRRKGSDSGTAQGLAKKRSWADVDDEVPTGPNRERKMKKGRKMSYKYEDEYGDIGRGEGERESARYR